MAFLGVGLEYTTTGGLLWRNDQLVFLVCLHGFSFVKEQKRAGGLLYSSVLMYLFYLLTQNAIQ